MKGRLTVESRYGWTSSYVLQLDDLNRPLLNPMVGKPLLTSDYQKGKIAQGIYSSLMATQNEQIYYCKEAMGKDFNRAHHSE